ncbi:hypothetical protein AOZ06_07080 [Kibdelosporangium phytohabitans]|uniref:Uncharacterized protein n=1 Tax=Kibdelosporangium phytohabitans TaxID=860235 RepID=A0A0N9HXV8_9PSEU|nr:hypothetical protein [Kibdelosporangium phytohabitans]ALG06722.1 hypothetical protein AOZ06_07080 [Kibdelosporangium phytohabitans]
MELAEPPLPQDGGGRPIASPGISAWIGRWAMSTLSSMTTATTNSTSSVFLLPGRAGVVHDGHAAVVHPRGQLRFPFAAGDHRGPVVGFRRRAQRSPPDLAIQPGVQYFPDLAHAAAAQRPAQPVPLTDHSVHHGAITPST